MHRKLSEQRWEQITNSTNMKHQCWELNPGQTSHHCTIHGPHCTSKHPFRVLHAVFWFIMWSPFASDQCLLMFMVLPLHIFYYSNIILLLKTGMFTFLETFKLFSSNIYLLSSPWFVTEIFWKVASSCHHIK